MADDIRANGLREPITLLDGKALDGGTEAAFEAIARTLPLGSVGYENQTNERGERLIWLDPTVMNRLRAMRGQGDSYSDVILRLAANQTRP